MYDLCWYIIDEFYTLVQVVCLVHVKHFDLRESSSLHYQRQKSAKNRNSNNWRLFLFVFYLDITSIHIYLLLLCNPIFFLYTLVENPLTPSPLIVNRS